MGVSMSVCVWGGGGGGGGGGGEKGDVAYPKAIYMY